MSTLSTPSVRQPKDYGSDQEIRWCPGCGDYSVLAQIKKALPSVGKHHDKIG